MAANNLNLPQTVLDDIITATNATDVQLGKTLQELWSGYGSIVQLQLTGTPISTAILKLIEPPQQSTHPRGWNTLSSHQRKIRSYQVETHWYQHYASLCNAAENHARCKVPSVIAAGSRELLQWILMEDLTSTYPRRAAVLDRQQAEVCLQWLAAFHATFLNRSPTGLWDVGTYWHLATRQDELKSMPDGQLKTLAIELDERLNQCEYQSFVHGDAKVANFCFTDELDAVAAVDFQYVGGGVGIKDVAYFLGSCLDEATIEQYESDLLSIYFKALHKGVTTLHGKNMATRVEQEWAQLYAIAWTDFYRFLEGWMPGHKKINRYTKQVANRAFDQLLTN